MHSKVEFLLAFWVSGCITEKKDSSSLLEYYNNNNTFRFTSNRITPSPQFPSLKETFCFIENGISWSNSSYKRKCWLYGLQQYIYFNASINDFSCFWSLFCYSGNILISNYCSSFNHPATHTGAERMCILFSFPTERDDGEDMQLNRATWIKEFTFWRYLSPVRNHRLWNPQNKELFFNGCVSGFWSVAGKIDELLLKMWDRNKEGAWCHYLGHCFVF